MIQFVECSSLELKQELRDFTITLNSDKLQLNNVNNILYEKLGRKMRLYNFYGIEIIDDSDLDIYIKERNKVIFFTKSKNVLNLASEIFQNKNILRLFKLKKKLGEVNNFLILRVVLAKFTWLSKGILKTAMQ
jgi:hypothetical protein